LKKDVPRQNLLKKPAEQNREAAEGLALEALSYLAADEERLTAFAAAAGFTAETIRAAAEAPGFLAAVLDYVAGDESLLLAFAANRGLTPAEVARAWRLLSAPPEDG
jgi:hypothetical protein